MHSYECVRWDFDAIFYRSGKLPLVILAEMKHQFSGRRAILKGDVQPREVDDLDPYRLKLPLDVSKLVMPTGSGGERPHTKDCAIAYELC